MPRVMQRFQVSKSVSESNVSTSFGVFAQLLQAHPRASHGISQAGSRLRRELVDSLKD